MNINAHLLCFGILFSFFTKEISYTSLNQERLRDKTKLFLDLLSRYSNADNLGEKGLKDKYRRNILDLFENGSSFITNDLDNNKESDINIDIVQYLRLIEQDYSNKIKVEFKDTIYLDCLTDKSAYVVVKKELSRSSTSYNMLITFNIETYEITQVEKLVFDDQCIKDNFTDKKEKQEAYMNWVRI